MNSQQIIFLVIGIIILLDIPIMYFVVKRVKARSKKLTEMLERQALKRNGTLKKFWGMVTLVMIPVDGVDMLLTTSSGGKNSPPRTSLSGGYRSLSKVTMSVSKEHALSTFLKRLGVQDIELMNPDFDREFIVAGNNEMIVRNILDATTQNYFLEWKDASPTLNVFKNRLSFSVGKMISEENELDRFLDTAVAVIRKVLQAG